MLLLPPTPLHLLPTPLSYLTLLQVVEMLSLMASLLRIPESVMGLTLMACMHVSSRL